MFVIFLKTVSKLISKLTKIVVALIVVLLLMELCLRLWIDLFPVNVRNIILSRYNSEPDGIYFLDSEWAMNIIKPNFQQRMFYNGFRWYHQSNEIGIRDKRNIDKVDIICLGDSMIYGHAVNIENTLCYYLESISGEKVANLGVQGDYPPFEYLRLKYLGLFLRPKIVLFFINNDQDFDDFLQYNPSKGYIEKIISDILPDYSLGIQFSQYLRNYHGLDVNSRYRLDNMLLNFRTFKTINAYRLIALKRAQFIKSKNEAGKMEIIETFLEQIILDANRLCSLNNARMIVVSHPVWVESKLKEICKNICFKHDVLFLDLKEDFKEGDYFLKNDWHYSPKGNEWAAYLICQYLNNHGLL